MTQSPSVCTSVCTQLSQSAPSYIPEYHPQSDISSPSKAILVWGEARSHRAPNLYSKGAASPGWFDVSPKISAQDMMHEWVNCCDEAANHQLPIAVALWIIQMISGEECSSLSQNFMQIHHSTHSVILNATTTQYTRSLSGIHCPHWLVQWSHHCSRMCIQSSLLGCQATSMSSKLFLLH